MSILMHCDNSTCDETVDPSCMPLREARDPQWVTVLEGRNELHFHNATCLARHLVRLVEKESA